MLLEDIEREGQPLVEELGVDTEVELAGLLPRQVRVGEHALDQVAGIAGLGLAEIGGHAVRRLVVLQVGETVARKLVVTHQTVRCAQLEVVEPLYVPHESLLRDDPADGACREYAVALAAGEVLRAVVTDVELEEVLVPVVVGRAA